MPSVEIFGEKRLARAVDKLDRAVSKRAIQKSVRDGAETIRDEAARLAPRDTGSLARRMRWEWVTQRKGVFEANVGPDSRDFHGLFVEFGTENMPPVPFMRPAFDQSLSEIARKTRIHLVRAVRRGR